MALTIRPLAQDDEPQWRRLWRDYLAFHETDLSDENCATNFARLLGDDPRDFNGLIAKLEGRAVGFAHFLFHRHSWSVQDVCCLQDLYTDPEVRGRGVGRALIQAVYAAADAAGAPSVYWLTQEFNTRGRTLYDRIGQVTPFILYRRAG